MSQSKLEIPTPAPPPAREIAELEDRVDRVVVIRPARRWPHLDVSELWHFRELLARLVWRDVSVRYKQTFLGVAWALLVPVFTAAVYVVIFGKFAQFPAGEENTAYPSLVLAGVIPMQYFASSLTGSSMSLAANLQLVTKVYFPRTLLPLGAVIVPLIDFLVGLPVLIALMWYYDTWPDGANVLFAPLLHPARDGHGARARLPALGGQRPLPGRPLHDPGLPPGPAAPLRRDVRRSRRSRRSGSGSSPSTR